MACPTKEGKEELKYERHEVERGSDLSITKRTRFFKNTWI
jgi:hypothetical protein